MVTLRDYPGYVMRLLNTMRPFKDFGFTGVNKTKNKTKEDEKIPDWLSKLDRRSAEALLLYRDTGGLRRRLNALAQCAAILSRMHGTGLVYSDVSDNNVFVSQMSPPESPEELSVWFIDADNLQYNDGKCSVIGTPVYGVPEVMQGTGVPSCSGDCYAFAIMAFWMLTLQHPFLTSIVDEDDADDEAYAGRIPFVDDPDDESNNETVFPRSLFLNQTLVSLFEEMFCAGRVSPAARPPALVLACALAQAADSVIACPRCGMTYYHVENICPYCDTQKPPFFTAKTYINSAQITAEEPCWIFTRELTRPVYLPRRLFAAFTPEGNDEGELELRFESNGGKKKVILKKPPSASLDFSYSLQGKDTSKPLSHNTEFDDFNFRLHVSGGGFSRTVIFNLEGSL
jgi:serine/threonine protein kinase